MTIYTRFGSEVKILANCGECQPKGFKTTQTLLRVEYVESVKPNVGYYFMDFLKSTEGWQEIQQAVDTALDITLEHGEFERAIKEAM